MTAQLSKLLVDEPPLVVARSVVRVFGLQEALLLQQLHYWLYIKSLEPHRYKDHFIDGRYWVHWTYDQLQKEVPFGAQSLDPYKRVTRKLREQGVLLVDKHGQAWDQTNWYSINYDGLRIVLAEYSVPNGCTKGDLAPESRSS